MNKRLALGILGFVGGFGAMTASRLSDGALAVIAGVSVGLIASTVIGILLIYAMRGRPKPADPGPQQQAGYPGMPYPYAGHMMPPIVVMPSYPQQALGAPMGTRTDVRMDSAVRVPFMVEDDDNP